MEKAGAHEVIVFDYKQGYLRSTTGRGDRIAGKGGKKHGELNAKTCTCEKVIIYKLPCSHVLAVCRYRSLSYSGFVNASFLTTEYRSTYMSFFKPVLDMHNCSPYDGPRIIVDERLKRGAGRPRSTRIQNEMDAADRPSKYRCSIHKVSGYNKQRCLNKNGEGTSGSDGAIHLSVLDRSILTGQASK
ncbi:uncharacterized protein LOC130591420 [Beta vulgaris subsp. vulgaris]|uniref:uncharacterized protein LOC130591420 n=1 Tax=Beta vulgaris subsp. vulgaris TaxID=3555 RepID=UPI00254767FC|nr:uncharacterized protein LOC130591420 [Beta vulgaris subsp. vulgaris]